MIRVEIALTMKIFSTLTGNLPIKTFSELYAKAPIMHSSITPFSITRYGDLACQEKGGGEGGGGSIEGGEAEGRRRDKGGGTGGGVGEEGEQRGGGGATRGINSTRHSSRSSLNSAAATS